VLREVGMTTARGWRSWFGGAVERKVDAAEADARIAALIAAGQIVPVIVEDDPKTPRLVGAEDFPLLETLHSSSLPDDWQPEWQPLETTTTDEMVFLSPLEIVSARGRAKPLFGFDYLWEVYKPESKRRWGYYTLPILYRDALVARFDSKLHRASAMLVIKGFWLENDVLVDEQFIAALAAGFCRFARFVGAESVDMTGVQLLELRQALQDRVKL
jgi:uncharacterized protein YcaQ